MPPAIAEVLGFLRILLVYGRHLADTLEHRAALRSFSIIAQCFGTAELRSILARVARGIMRAIALERVLLARAARGRDLVFLQPRQSRSSRSQTGQSQPDQSQPGQSQPGQTEPGQPPGGQSQPDPAGGTSSRTRAARRPEWDMPLDLSDLPTLAEFEAEIRRRPIGRTLADICRDLGVMPGMCERFFGGKLWLTMQAYRGNVAKLSVDFQRRRIAFGNWLDWNFVFDWPDRSREGPRRQLGFLIGETPALPAGPPVPAGPPQLFGASPAIAARPP